MSKKNGPRVTAGIIKSLIWGFGLALIWITLPDQQTLLPKTPDMIFSLGFFIAVEFGIVLVVSWILTRRV